MSKKIESLLAKIPPRPEYNDWIKICSAVCHELKGNEQEAERILTNWSPDYGRKTTKDLIRSFKGIYKCTGRTLSFFAGVKSKSQGK